MGYEVALTKAWEKVAALGLTKTETKFLADTYSVDLEARKVFSLSCNTAAKDFTTILILHYLAASLKGLPALTNEWASFKELSGIEGYAEAFRQRSILPILHKYGRNPSEILSVLERFPGKRVNEADIGIVVEVFAQVPVMILLWRSDDEFGPEASILFDKNINRIFCIEDIVVLAGLVAAQL